MCSSTECRQQNLISVKQHYRMIRRSNALTQSAGCEKCICTKVARLLTLCKSCQQICNMFTNRHITKSHLQRHSQPPIRAENPPKVMCQKNCSTTKLNRRVMTATPMTRHTSTATQWRCGQYSCIHTSCCTVSWRCCSLVLQSCPYVKTANIPQDHISTQPQYLVAAARTTPPCVQLPVHAATAAQETSALLHAVLAPERSDDPAHCIHSLTHGDGIRQKGACLYKHSRQLLACERVAPGEVLGRSAAPVSCQCRPAYAAPAPAAANPSTAQHSTAAHAYLVTGL
jgi:hypothetical protein